MCSHSHEAASAAFCQKKLETFGCVHVSKACTFCSCCMSCRSSCLCLLSVTSLLMVLCLSCGARLILDRTAVASTKTRQVSMHMAHAVVVHSVTHAMSGAVVLHKKRNTGALPYACRSRTAFSLSPHAFCKGTLQRSTRLSRATSMSRQVVRMSK